MTRTEFSGAGSFPFSYDSLAVMEQFATTIAALAPKIAPPEDMLQDVLQSITESMQRAGTRQAITPDMILEEKARQAGYTNLQHFHTDLLHQIRKQMLGLQLSELTATHRDHLRVIAN